MGEQERANISLDHNGHECLHHVTKFDPDTDEEFCNECGDVIEAEVEAADTF